MKKAIIVASYGSSRIEARENGIEPIVDLIKETFKDYKVVSVYTSLRIRKKLGKEGFFIPSPIGEINNLIDEGYHTIYIQPLHLIPGSEFMKFKVSVEAISGDRANVRCVLGNPLLRGKKDDLRIMEI